MVSVAGTGVWLLSWSGGAAVTTSAGVRDSFVKVNCSFRLAGDHPTRRGVELVRFSLSGGSVAARRKATGAISVMGGEGKGIILDDDRGRLRLNLEARINYESLDEYRGVDTQSACYYIPATEPCAAVVEGVLRSPRVGMVLERARIAVACAAGEFGEVQAIEIRAPRIALRSIADFEPRYRLGRPGQWAPLNDANTDANICIEVNQKSMVFQPVGFRASASDPSPSGGTAAAQFATAAAVWAKACVSIVTRPMIFITNATLKTSSDLAAIRAAYTDSDPDAIEVFFVANALSAQGGGQAGGIGLASCKPVIAEPNGGNPVLLAHELGHVINLQHPGVGSNSDAGSVMAPTGSAMNPGTNLVTHFMAINVANPVMDIEPTLCCLKHDIGNHYLRDFPVDPGNEPSDPLPAGMTRYSMSNVWNRLTNTAGTWSAATGPEHQSPVRFNADMTAKTNYLFARVEQTVNLQVRNAAVKFYMKHPGSGGGAVNLQMIGQVAVPAALAVGAPQTVSLPWTVPAGTPAHSCIFAVVRSDAEQDGNQSTLDWWQFEALSRQDNDWAQRNLDIEDYDSGNQGDSNLLESGLFFIELPPPHFHDRPELWLEVNAAGATQARAVEVEIVGEDVHAVRPGRQGRIRVPLRRRQGPVVAIVRIRAPGGLPVGHVLGVGVTPRIGQREMIGFSVAFRSARPADVIRQTLDRMLGAFVDIGSHLGHAGADEIICRLRELTACGPYTIRKLVEAAVGLCDGLRKAAPELSRLPQARQTGLGEALKRFFETAEAFQSGRATVADTLVVVRSLTQRLEGAASLALRPGSSR